jgi:hypothetical protein
LYHHFLLLAASHNIIIIQFASKGLSTAFCKQQTMNRSDKSEANVFSLAIESCSMCESSIKVGSI